MELRKREVLVYGAIIVVFLLTVQLSNRFATVFSEQILPKGSNCIVIDPGHGGVDGGATSCTGKLESHYNLEIALRLNTLFRFLGYDTKMIRTEDVSIHTRGETIAQKKIIDLKERVRIVNETDNGLLISIHQNIYSDSRYSGAQVFYPNTSGSKELAEKLQTTLIAQLNPGSTRRCKRSEGIYLMEHIQKRGILVECGFLSNQQEAYLLQQPGYQLKLTGAICAALTEYLEGERTYEV